MILTRRRGSKNFEQGIGQWPGLAAADQDFATRPHTEHPVRMRHEKCVRIATHTSLSLHDVYRALYLAPRTYHLVRLQAISEEVADMGKCPQIVKQTRNNTKTQIGAVSYHTI